MRYLTVSRDRLALLAAAAWLGVGVLLVVRGWGMLTPGGAALAAEGAGAAGGVIVALLGFSRVAARNVRRIEALPERASPLAFMAPASYVLVAFMMGLGIFLRRCSFVPRVPLAALYFAIGSALALSSGVYLSAARRLRGRAAEAA